MSGVRDRGRSGGGERERERHRPLPSAPLSCVSPLRCCSDFRPYFTIHDSEFKEYTTRTQAPSVTLLLLPLRHIYSANNDLTRRFFSRPSVILGVTNPFFAKTLQHWPHIIRIGDMKQAGGRSFILHQLWEGL